MNSRGFVRAVVMEGMIIAAIIAIVAAIAIPQYTNYKNRHYDREAKAHAYQAYQASQALFRKNPKAIASLNEISQYGYHSSADITLIIYGGKENLFIKAMHVKSNKAYTINSKGELSSD